MKRSDKAKALDVKGRVQATNFAESQRIRKLAKAIEIAKFRRAASQDNIDFENIIIIEDQEQWDEEKIIQLLGVDAYIELMCRIEEEIRQEDSPPPPDEVDFDEYQEDGEDLEGSRSILCPDCRYFFLV